MLGWKEWVPMVQILNGIWNMEAPNQLKSKQMATILSKTIWNLAKISRFPDMLTLQSSKSQIVYLLIVKVKLDNYGYTGLCFSSLTIYLCKNEKHAK